MNSPETDKLIDWAVYYAQRGWFVFPAREKVGEPFTSKKGKLITPPVKAPYMKRGLWMATTDLKQIYSWWDTWPNAAIGINCGMSNLFTIDIDRKKEKHGYEEFRKLHIDDNGALHSITPSGGMHIIFTGQGRTSSKDYGIDTRGKGGYIIAPPSIIENSGRYIFVEDEIDFIPMKISEEVLEVLGVSLKEKNNKKENKNIAEIPMTEQIIRIKKALENIPKEFVNNYSDWVNVGLALKNLGQDGFHLWDVWSRKSYKYDETIMEEKWETFYPNSISLGSIFYWAKMGLLEKSNE